MPTQGRGWHGQSKKHAEAAKGNKTAGKSAKGSGWHSDSEGHSKASRGKSAKKEGLMDRLKGE